jgi:hypothetical protein
MKIYPLLQEAEVLFSQDETFIASRTHYETVFDALVKVKEKFNIINNPTALLKIFELAGERVAEINLS